MNNTEALKIGPYSLVSLIGYDLTTQADREFRSKRAGLGAKVKAMWSGRRNLSGEEVASNGLLALHLVNDHQVSTKDLKYIPTGDTQNDHLKRANILAMTSVLHETDLRDQRRRGTQLSYILGLVLADFIDIIPRDLGSKLILSAADPAISQSIVKGEGTLKFRGTDTQALAVEATVLLPRESRFELFSEMAKQSPGLTGRANRFLSFVAVNWSQRTSSYSGMGLISANLPSDFASVQMAQVQEDMVPLRELIESNF